MITEMIRFNCHILDVKQHPDGTTPEQLLKQHQGTPSGLIFEGVYTEVVSCKWAANSKTSILTKVKRIDS